MLLKKCIGGYKSYIEKPLISEQDMSFLKQCPSAKNKKGHPLSFFNIHFVAKYQKIEGDLWRYKKFFEKNKKIWEQSHSAEKCKDGTVWALLSSSWVLKST